MQVTQITKFNTGIILGLDVIMMDINFWVANKK